MESYTTILNEGHFEYEDRKSVFIGIAAPIDSEAKAIDLINYAKRKYPDARHHVYAYVLRDNSIMRFSDDREPQGTAGMPVLDAIRKNGCTDTGVVVVRYFGGTLLGTGGLVRAYSAAAIGALHDAKIVTYDLYSTYNVVTSYSDYQKIIPIIESEGFRIKNTDYNDSVIIKGSILSKNSEEFVKKIKDITSARVIAEKIDERFEY